MNERKCREYATEFKLEALALLKRGDKSASQIERELGITPGLLVKRRNRYQIVEREGQAIQIGPSDLESAKAEIRRLQPELAGVEEECEILKKSAQYFLPKKRMKYAFMVTHEHEFTVKRMCQALGV